jgi:hypothetical protein
MDMDLDDFLEGDKIRLKIRTIERGLTEHVGVITRVDDKYGIRYDLPRSIGGHIAVEGLRLNLRAVGKYPFGVVHIEVL